MALKTGDYLDKFLNGGERGPARRVAAAFSKAFSSRIFLTKLFAVSIFALLIVSSEGWEHKFRLFDEALFMAGVMLVALCLVGRAWSLSYISGSKNRVLTTTGPYSLCRNPLYFSNFLGGLGLGLCTETISIPFLIAAVFALYYPGVIEREESRLHELFGPEFEEYARRVPRFLPSVRGFVENESITISTRPFRRGLMELVALVLAIGLIEFVEALHESQILASYFSLF